MAQETQRRPRIRKRTIAALLMLALMPLALLCQACGESQATSQTKQATQSEPDESTFLVAIEEEPDTVDFQRTSIHYTIATNVFNRLVEMEPDATGTVAVTPSLADSWEESKDGKTYTFHLHEGVTFSNGSPLTSSDVCYSFTRLLTHPDSCSQDIVENIKGAAELEAGKTDKLEGFNVIDDLNFSITLEEPFEAFLACLSMPGASIMDEESASAAGDVFGMDPEHTIGTGPFVLKEWEAGKGMKLVANETCWSGLPACAGLDLRFITDAGEVRKLFDNGELDIMDLDDQDSAAEFYVHGESYRDRIYEVPQIGITYIALNESIAPLDDVRVRKALQLGLDRDALLSAVYSGRGAVENGIYSHGLYGFNPDLPTIPHDQTEAQKLLAEAGYPDGFDLTFYVKSSSTQWEMTLAKQAATMWETIGVRTNIEVLPESDFMSLRKSGKLACYTATWTADYNDPDNYIYTFYGNKDNTTFRSLCYPREDIMDRVRKARGIIDPAARLKEYQGLERIIAQEDAAWIPLFSRTRLYVTSKRLKNFQHAWNGSVKNVYSKMSIDTTT